MSGPVLEWVEIGPEKDLEFPLPPPPRPVTDVVSRFETERTKILRPSSRRPTLEVVPEDGPLQKVTPASQMGVLPGFTSVLLGPKAGDRLWILDLDGTLIGTDWNPSVQEALLEPPNEPCLPKPSSEWLHSRRRLDEVLHTFLIRLFVTGTDAIAIVTLGAISHLMQSMACLLPNSFHLCFHFYYRTRFLSAAQFAPLMDERGTTTSWRPSDSTRKKWAAFRYLNQVSNWRTPQWLVCEGSLPLLGTSSTLKWSEVNIVGDSWIEMNAAWLEFHTVVPLSGWKFATGGTMLDVELQWSVLTHHLPVKRELATFSNSELVCLTGERVLWEETGIIRFPEVQQSDLARLSYLSDLLSDHFSHALILLVLSWDFQ